MSVMSTLASLRRGMLPRPEVLTQRSRYFLVEAGRKGEGWGASVSDRVVLGEEGREEVELKVEVVEEESVVGSVVVEMLLLEGVRFGVWGDVLLAVGAMVCDVIRVVPVEDWEVMVFALGPAACLAKATAAV